MCQMIQVFMEVLYTRNNQMVPNILEPINELSPRDIIFGQMNTERIRFVSCLY